eukprot:jgi/Hompol1/4759/HPOL_001841-RA
MLDAQDTPHHATQSTRHSAKDDKDSRDNKDVKYFALHLMQLPHHYLSGDSSRMTLAFFAIGAFDLLGVLDQAIDDSKRKAAIDWVYAMQVHPSEQYPAESGVCGFRGSSSIGAPFNPIHSVAIHSLDTAHVTMTFTALTLLLILGDDLERVDAKACVRSLAKLQNPDGGFRPSAECTESDVRFLYCACVISYLLNDWSGVNRKTAVKYIRSLRGFEHGFGQVPGQESHGGSTFCAIAALWLMNELDSDALDRDKTIFWLLSRQVEGFQGRPDKPADTCYTFWIGGALEMLGAFQPFVNKDLLFSFMDSTHHATMGGHAKLPYQYPDLMHSYLGLAGLSIAKAMDLAPIIPALNISERAYAHWRSTKFGHE